MVGSYILLLRIKKWKALVGFILISCSLCVAQENIRFERISVNDGLSQSDVRSMVQDKFGFLWIGTRDGLNKYDGFEFTLYNRKENDSTSLYFNQIFDIEIDSSGDMWIGSAGGISIYNHRKNSFQNFFPTHSDLQDADVNHILVTGQNAALLSTSKGLVSFDRNGGRFFFDRSMMPL